jgi:hypothetical protein
VSLYARTCLSHCNGPMAFWVWGISTKNCNKGVISRVEGAARTPPLLRQHSQLLLHRQVLLQRMPEGTDARLSKNIFLTWTLGKTVW